MRDAASERDEQGRFAVPARDFVAANGVRTAVGLGSGYRTHPSLLMLFAFTSENVEAARMEPLVALLDDYASLSEELVASGRIFVE